MSREEVYELIGLQLAGEASRDQKDMLKAWLEESPDNVVAYQQLKRTWQNTRVEVNHPFEDRQFDRVMSTIRRAEEKTPAPASRIWLKIAAAIAIIVTSVWVVMQKEEEIPLRVKEVSFITKFNPTGQKTSFILPDGSKVWLNSASTVTYASDFGQEHRELTLSGQAFFDVKKDPERAFVVSSGNMKTTALGTSFGVQAFPDANRINVALVSGKVRVDEYRHDSLNVISSQTYLWPGEQVTYYKSDQTLEKGAFEHKEAIAWKDGTLYFEDTDLLDAFKTLERWYGVRIHVNNPPVKEERTLFGRVQQRNARQCATVYGLLKQV